MPSKSEKLKKATELVYSDKIDLFAEVKDLTDRERELILEANYRRRLRNLSKRIKKDVLASLNAHLKRGEVPQEAVLAIRQEFSHKVALEYMDEALANMKRCLYSGWEREEKQLYDAVNDKYLAELKSASPEKRKTMAPLPERAVEPVAFWEIKPRVEQLLSNRSGYSGDFYSVFFGTRQDDIRFFENLRAGLQQGEGVQDLVERTYKALLEPTTPAEREQFLKKYEKNCGEVTKGRLENVVRTECARAFEKGKIEAAKDSDLVAGYLFSAIDDDRITEVCLARDKALIRGDDWEIIDSCTPPLHYQCRSTLVPLLRQDYEAEGGDERADYDRIRLENAPDFDW